MDTILLFFFFPRKQWEQTDFIFILTVFLVASFISWSLTFLGKKTFSYHLLIPAAFFLSVLLCFRPSVHTAGEVSENQTLGRERLVN